MIRRFIISTGARVAGAALQAALFIILTRAYTPAEYGVLMAVVSVLSVFFGVVDYGMNVRYLSLEREPRRDGFYGFGATARACALAITLLAATAISLDGDRIATLLLWSAVAFAIGESFGETAVAAFQGQLRPGTAATFLLLRRGFALGPLAISPTSDGFLVGAGLSMLIGLTAYLFAVAPRWGRPLHPRIILRENMAFALASGGPQVSQLDSSVIVMTASSELAGLYSPATRLLNPVNMAILSLTQVFVPELSRTTDAGTRLTFFKKTRRLVIALAAMTLPLAVLSPWITVTLFGEDYVDSTPMVAAAFIAAGLSGVAQVHLAWFYGTNLARRIPLLMITCSVIGLLLMATLGPPLGVPGLAAAFLIMHGSVCATLVVAWSHDIRSTSN